MNYGFIIIYSATVCGIYIFLLVNEYNGNQMNLIFDDIRELYMLQRCQNLMVVILSIVIKGKFDVLANNIYNCHPRSDEINYVLRYFRQKFKECCLGLEEYNRMFYGTLSCAYCASISVICFVLCILLYKSVDKYLKISLILILCFIIIITLSIILVCAQVSISAMSPLMELKRFCTVEMDSNDRLQLISTLKLLDGPGMGIQCLDFTVTKLTVTRIIESSFSLLSSLKEVNNGNKRKKCK
ncbi:uncharacterized protein [Centruroides vittatus]|uniref:uncharacterized protein n=1 Tax=Centruroides vittatus TaxID=120091 RepID=UPI00350FFFCF